MKIIDLTHRLENGMTVYSEEENINIRKVATFEIDKFRTTNFNIFTHNGTHIDAPYHLLKDGKKLEDYQLERFLLKVSVVYIPNKEYIEYDDLKMFDELISKNRGLIIKTDHYKKWNTERYSTSYPTLTKDAANYLKDKEIELLGVDTLSPDLYNSIEIHKILLENDILILENLNLEGLEVEEGMLSTLPLKYKDADGSFVRAVIIIE